MRRRVLLAIGLYFLSPLVAEYLLGDIAITAIPLFAAIPLLLGMSLLYGTGALLIREVVRRASYGWPSIIAFALAYGIIEEGFTTYTLFNPNWDSAFGFHILAYGYIPALGLSLNWIIFVLGLHTFWSISTPIALMETLAGEQQRTKPWLSKLALSLLAALFVLAIVGINIGNVVNHRFIATIPQFIGTGIATIVVVGIGILLGQRKPTARTQAGRAPSPWLVMLVALIAASVFLLIYAVDPSGISPWLAGLNLPAWIAIVLYLLLCAGMAVLVSSWSQRRGWSDAHRFALAAGALLAYAWHSFPWPVLMPGVSLMLDLLSNAILAVGAIILLVFAARQLQKEGQQSFATLAHNS
ncbi:hypothetical protein EPA93_19915 [Ktedonosporobacter rubrisoli]|uniref:DUF998 domain-containing protein n=1 Tax=Ktedonosporobacter rubrisoli TaxID=2509675 RepID=A0A4P6JSD9_KTERU|nr:hypothetical protein [Ktedonosporobacter rubrisoli]QBD78140.1 hypothetical protein EPA93_19915 [Ktedonosporobacter rubrisoli]